MFAITAITGQVGSALARRLLATDQQVRAVVRNPNKSIEWVAQGCAVALADMNDAKALTEAFHGSEGVFILLPPTFDPSIGFPEARHTIRAIRTALAESNPPKVVCLSTIGADSNKPNLLNQLGILEQELMSLSMPIAFLRAAWFMENAVWDVASAAEDGVIHSFLQPLDKPFPMISTDDVGRVAGDLLQEEWEGKRVVNLEGPERITPNVIAESFSKLLKKTVRVEMVQRDTWQDLFISQGMKNPTPRIQMLDGFNQGWIKFDESAELRKGIVTLESTLKKLIDGGQVNKRAD